MTRDEVKKIMMVIKTYYDNFAVSKEKVDAWFAILGRYDYPQISQALAYYVETDPSGFPPAIGQLTNRNKNRFLNFKQHRYRYADIEKQLLNTKPLEIGVRNDGEGKDLRLQPEEVC